MAQKLRHVAQNESLGGHRAMKNDRQTENNMLKMCALELAFQKVSGCSNWLRRKKVRAETATPCPG